MITQKRVKEVFYYLEGNLYWRSNLGTRAKAGTIAGNKNAGGYYNVQVDKKQYYIHRLIYLYFYGYMPEFIDHKHGSSVGNYLWNLRSCTRSQNMANKGMNKNNTSGFRGVFKKSSKWIARITVKGKSIQIGVYFSAKDASDAFELKAKELHGKFYNPIQIKQTR